LNKRHFLTAIAACASATSAPSFAASSQTAASGPTLLTVTGNIGSGNRGPLDPGLDQMMKKQGLAFDKAHVFDYAALLALPEVAIKPTLQYDGKPHLLSGPLLIDVIKAAGATINADGQLLLRAVDGYVIAIPVAVAQKYRFIVATRLDGKPMALGGLGPLWAIYDADRFPDMAARPLAERFTLCPWALYHIAVQG
jgi:hypothetical protein